MINAQSIINEVMQAHAVALDETTSFLYFKTSARGRHRVIGCKKNLQRFADLVRKNAAAFGGGIVRTEKMKPAIAYPAKSVSLFKQLIEDHDYSAALDLATDKLGALFFMDNKGWARLQVAPVPVETMPGLSTVLNECGTYSIIEPVSMRSLGGGKRSRTAQIEASQATYDRSTTESKARVLATAESMRVDQYDIRAQWIKEHGIVSDEVITARIEAHDEIIEDVEMMQETGQAYREAVTAELERLAKFDCAQALRDAETMAKIDEQRIERDAETARKIAFVESMDAERAIQDVAQVIAHAVAAVAIAEAMQPSEAGELVTCEAGENEAQASTGASTYINGDRATYTGSSSVIHGGVFYEVKYDEGHRAGEMAATQRAPGESWLPSRAPQSSGIVTPQVPATGARVCGPAPGQPAGDLGEVEPVNPAIPSQSGTVLAASSADDAPAAIEKRSFNDWPWATGGWVVTGGGKNVPGYASEQAAKIDISRNKWATRCAAIIPFKYHDGGLTGCSPYAKLSTRFVVLVKRITEDQEQATPTPPAAARAAPDVYAHELTEEVYYSTPVVKIGRHEWVTQVYQHAQYGRCTRSLWRFTNGDATREITRKYPGHFDPKTYTATRGTWYDDKKWPSYDGDDGSYSGLPKTLPKLYYANEAVIKAALEDRPASKPNSEAIDAQSLIDAGYHPTVAECIEHHGISAYGPMAQAEIRAKLAAHQASEAPQIQQVTGKSGKWRASFYMRRDGKPCMKFYGGNWDEMERAYPTETERIKALQAMAMTSNATDDTPAVVPDATPTPSAPDPVNPVISDQSGAGSVSESRQDAPEFDPESFDMTGATVRQVQALTEAQFQAVYDHLEDWNFHTECVLLHALRAGKKAIAADLRALMKEHLKIGYMSDELIIRRQALSNAIDAPTPPAGEAAPVNPAGEASSLGAPYPVNPAPSNQSPTFERAKPIRMDLADIVAEGRKPEALIGMGVFCSGDMANPAGSGAITAVGLSKMRGFTVDIALEDGRVFQAVQTRQFVDGWFSLDTKMHGAPYLAELAATVASVKASASAAKEQTATAHALALVNLAAQYPQLKRAESRYAGGKLAAVNIRTLLKAAFKGQKFSVTSDYNSARLGWEDGPTADQVNEVVGRFDIGAADYQSDYFYTVSTAFSDLFGGVQYLRANRHESDALIQRAINQLYPDAANRPSVQDYRKGDGVFSWQAGSAAGRELREMLGTLGTFSTTNAKA